MVKSTNGVVSGYSIHIRFSFLVQKVWCVENNVLIPTILKYIPTQSQLDMYCKTAVSCLSFIQGVVCCRNGLGHAPKTLPGFLTVIYEPIYLSTTLFVLRVHQKHVVWKKPLTQCLRKLWWFYLGKGHDPVWRRTPFPKQELTSHYWWRI